MRKEASLPIRLDTDLSRRLDRAARRLGLTKSALIRILIKSFVDEFEASGGKMALPFSWQASNTVQSSSSLRSVVEPRERSGAKTDNR